MEVKISATYTDLYQLRMAQAYFLKNKKDLPVTFDYFFRKIPFGGGYVIFAGLADLLKALDAFEFTPDDINFLADLDFERSFLNFIEKFKFRGHIYSPKEGEIVFPTEPVLRVEGTILEVQLIETLLLNILNFESLIATKASRMRTVAGEKVLSEFGLRRAQGLGSVMASRAAIIGGFDSTSNVYAAKEYNLICAGTMAHSFIQMYDDELTAFRAYANTNPNGVVLLVDTYNSLKSGVPNAITVAKEMEGRGEKLSAIRLDSGDLSFFARKARQMLDEAGLGYVKIVASNQLDEYVIRSLEQQNAPIDIFGVGTSLVTGQPDAALDGVFKLVMSNHEYRIKLSEQIRKTTLPGNKQVYRYLDKDGFFSGIDAIAQIDEAIPGRIISPFDELKSTNCSGDHTFALLQPVMKDGKTLAIIEDVDTIKRYVTQRLGLLPLEYKRFENPHIYKVGISPKTHRIREELRQKHNMQ